MRLLYLVISGAPPNLEFTRDLRFILPKSAIANVGGASPGMTEPAAQEKVQLFGSLFGLSDLSSYRRHSRRHEYRFAGHYSDQEQGGTTRIDWSDPRRCHQHSSSCSRPVAWRQKTGLESAPLLADGHQRAHEFVSEIIILPLFGPGPAALLSDKNAFGPGPASTGFLSPPSPPGFARTGSTNLVSVYNFGRLCRPFCCPGLNRPTAAMRRRRRRSC